MQNYFDSTHLYTLMEMQRAMVSPLNVAAKAHRELHVHPFNPFSYTVMGRSAAAYYELLERVTRHYARPEFGITHTKVDGKTVEIVEEYVRERPFCNLLHLKKKKTTIKQPQMLVVAPLSGHYATLLRGTVEALLPHFDVYITEWLNARDIPMSKGTFDFDDYVNYLMGFLHNLRGDVHVMAVCQPSVPVMAAVSIMSSKGDPAVPKTMTLIGGPIDTRINPTKVNKTAHERSIDWFERSVISRVPFNYPGFMRKVYPGFVQLTGFMTMNLDKHVGEHLGLFMHLVDGDGESAEAHRKFYNEYLSVLDLPAEFYLQTVKSVFQDYALPKGVMVSRGRQVKPQDIKKTALLCIEGEKDDISGVGQTKAAIKLCTGLPEKMKKYHLQEGVGHYGTFNGRRFREQIVPVIVDFCQKNS